MKKTRLDIYLVEKIHCESRSLAQRLIMAGDVLVNGQTAMKPSDMVLESDEVMVKEPAKYVSRGGEKLEAALIAFSLLSLRGKICADVGSSTGGFTDCLLQRGAEKVYAIDVGHGLLHWRLRNNPKIIVLEKTNARFVEKLPEPVDFVTIDASFISLKTLLPRVKRWMNSQGEVIALIKPQFEAGRELVAKGRGVIRDANVHVNVVNEIIDFSVKNGFKNNGFIESPILGPKGNKEFLIYLEKNE